LCHDVRHLVNMSDSVNTPLRNTYVGPCKYSIRWYFGGITRRRAVELLSASNNIAGSFLIRDSDQVATAINHFDSLYKRTSLDRGWQVFCTWVGSFIPFAFSLLSIYHWRIYNLYIRTSVTRLTNLAGGERE
jgi:hypothetical protein